MTIVQGLGGAFIRARDAQKLAAWYAEMFGLAFANYGESHCVEFPSVDITPSDRLATTSFAIFQQDESHRASPGASRINLRVSELDSLCSRLTDAGIVVTREPDESYGRFARLTDPQGHELELWEPPPAS